VATAQEFALNPNTLTTALKKHVGQKAAVTVAATAGKCEFYRLASYKFV
jgi:hypothetical protein